MYKKKISSSKFGLPPGTLLYVGEHKNEPISFELFEYNEEKLEHRHFEILEHVPDKKKITMKHHWFNLVGVHDPSIIEEVGRRYDLHTLLLEDVMNTHQRPNISEFEGKLFIVARMLTWKGKEMRMEQVSFVLGDNYVLSFQELKEDVFGPIRERIKNPKSKMRKKGSDFLLYVLLDTLVDSYFSALERFGEEIEELDARLFSEDDINEIPSKLYHIKRELMQLRRAIWPLRDVISSMLKHEYGIKKDTQTYLKDVYDHVIQLMDTLELCQEMSSEILGIYHTRMSNKMNETMKVLTIIATIFIPLSFLVGLYGMNFEYIPELNWRYGYVFVWVIILAISSLMLYYFRRKGWL